MKYAAAVDWLYGTQLHGIRPGLETTWRLAHALGVDVARLRVIHVAGTNGKGSVCAMVDSVCRAAGLKSGLFTSPHLITFRERIRVDGELIGEEEVAGRLSAIREITLGWQPVPTFFEITTALALSYFQAQGVEIVVLETGLGGRLDATNIVTPLVSVLTPIDFDHQQWLGSTLAEIAAEKAGIIKASGTVVSAPQPEEAETVIRHVAFERGARVHFVREPIENLAVGLVGGHQRWNAALAVHAIEHAGLDVAPDAVARGLSQVAWPGRFHRLTDELILDGAHNPAAARRLVETWREEFGDSKATLVLSVLKDKDLRAVCAALLPMAARVITTPVQNARTSSAEELRAIIRELDPEMDCAVSKDLRHALRVASTLRDRILVAGSLFLVGETLTLLHDEPTTEISDQ